MEQKPEPKQATRKRGQKIAAGEIDRLIGMRIRIARNMFHKRQEDLASFLELTLQQTQKYENGKNKMSVNLLTKVADFFRIPITYFIPTTIGTMEQNTIEMLTTINPINNVAEDWKPIGRDVKMPSSAKKISENITPIEERQSIILEFIDALSKIDNDKQKEFLESIKQYAKNK